MAVGKEIITKIRSVQNTQKITKAMQMVSTSKMRKTQERMSKARPYADEVRDVMKHLAATNPDEALLLLDRRENIKRACIVLITTDKGLCGGLNSNVLKVFFAKVKEYTKQGVPVDVVCFGLKGLLTCQRLGLNVIASTVGLGDIPRLEILLGSLKVVFDKYENKEIDVVHLMYSRFINTMKQMPVDEYFLPVGKEVLEGDESSSRSSHYQWDYIFEPSALEVLEFLVQRYLESVVYQAVCDSMASEQAARMVAMKSATDNASNAIKFLRLKYNKSRQAAITTELSEIVAGAAAV
ncbi:MAG: F0F1 ATP synthase subunit gamma [Neisseriaceae bacterium]|nr:MAG: F0F1 ATP synthase subunit gamma [Neisseriaceae bacterium]